MDLGKRKQALRQLTDAAHLAADKELLQAKKPHSRVLKLKFPTPERTQREVLWELLEVVTPKEIVANRIAVAKAAEEAAEKKHKEEEAAAEKKRQEEEAAAEKQAEQEALKKAELKNAAEKALKELDLEDKPDYKVMKQLVKDLEIETADIKKVTFIAALTKYKADLAKQPLPQTNNTPKTDEGNGEVNEVVSAKDNAPVIERSRDEKKSEPASTPQKPNIQQ